MKYFFFTISLLFVSVFATAQADTIFVMGAEFGASTVINDSTFQLTSNHPADQLGQGFLPTQIQVGYRLLDVQGRMFRVSSVVSANFGQSTLQVVELQDNNIGPLGVGVVYRKPDDSDCVPRIPEGNTGLSPAIVAIIHNHNLNTGCSVDDRTRLTQDSILVYTQGGVEVGRDTITGTGGGGGGSGTAAGTTIDNTNLQVTPSVTNLQEYAEAVDTALLNARSTGVRFGGALTDLGAGIVRIAAGSGAILDNSTPEAPVYNVVEWSQTDLNLSAVDDVYYIYVNSSGTVTSTTTAPTHPQYRTLIWLWRVSIRSGAVSGTASIVQPTQQYGPGTWDLWDAIGSVKDGIIIQPSGANLLLKHSAGEIYQPGVNFYNDATNPNETEVAAADTITFRHVDQTNTQTADRTALDVANYDNGGVITAIGGAITRATIFQWMYFPGSGNHRIFYGQTVYNNVAEALAALQDGSYSPTLPAAYSEAVTLGWIVAARNATALNDGTQVFVTSNKFGLTGGGIATASSDGLLAINNLSDVDDAATARANIGADVAANVNITDAGGYYVATDVEAALQEEAVNRLAVDAIAGDLVTLSGMPLSSTNLGTFTGSTISDNNTVKGALQELETEVETKLDTVVVFTLNDSTFVAHNYANGSIVRADTLTLPGSGSGGGGTDDQTAIEVPITDAGAYYTGTEVETALQEIGADLASALTGTVGTNQIAYGDGAGGLTGGTGLTKISGGIEIESQLEIRKMTGNNTIAIGANAANSTGSNGIAIGPLAAQNTTSGIAFVAIGNEAGRRITTSNFGVFIGAGAGANVTTSSSVVAIGQSAAQNATGAAWVAIGGSAAISKTSGSNWFAMGNQAAGNSTTGGNFVSIGTEATRFATTAGEYVSVGYAAGRDVVGGGSANIEQGVFLGSRTQSASTTTTNEIVIGYNAEGQGSNTATIGNSSVTDYYLQGTIHADDFALTPTDVEPVGAEGVIYWDDSENALKIHDGTSFSALGSDGNGVYDGSGTVPDFTTALTSLSAGISWADDNVSLRGDAFLPDIGTAAPHTYVGLTSSNLLVEFTPLDTIYIPVYCHPHDEAISTGSANYRGWRVPQELNGAKLESITYSFDTPGSDTVTIQIGNGTVNIGGSTVPSAGYITTTAVSQTLVEGERWTPSIGTINGTGHEGLMLMLMITK